jgi:hypothetical protein
MANPRGQQRDKPFRDALRMFLFSENGRKGRRKLDLAAAALVGKAVKGDVAALKELADRLDGKVAQAIVGDDEHDPISLRTIVTGVARASDDNDSLPGEAAIPGIPPQD